ncbi:ADP-ribosylglycohydrolase family protein [Geobacillus subterraneus]|uniref:ADP-ribosylglycohydrolase family protein n=1 Tax=Geobacillus subterraneus TaxID=129338 RepID=UPI001FD3A6DB|nr:ADP-ribosylglycohydrolase family protein [Geobacillus subterraneus]
MVGRMLDQIKGGLFGVAIGDALGATTEFMSAEDVRRTYGKVTDIIGGGFLNLSPGEVTDDTAMTMAVAKGIIRHPEHPMAAIGEEFLKWYETDHPDVGIIIRTVFSLYAGDWFAAASEACRKLGGKCAGNGSLMRCLPIALAYADQEKMEEMTALHSRMTHADDRAMEACLIYNRIAVRLLHGEPLVKAIRREVEHTRYEPFVNITPSCPPDGYVVHTMAWVLHWLLRCESFEDVVISAANMGGDSDTIAAIAGGLKGLEVGYSQLPKRFVETIVCAGELEELAVQLAGVRNSFGPSKTEDEQET